MLPRDRRLPRFFPAVLLAVPLVANALLGATVRAEPAKGPLIVHPTNPRYFATPDGTPVLLTGSHTWNNLVDMDRQDPPRPFDFEAHLDQLQADSHNFIRLWTWELPQWSWPRHSIDPFVAHTNYAQPLPWKRSGPESANDGKPQFDLATYDETYFSRLRHRVESAGQRGIYVSIMLFEGWCMQFAEQAWAMHPFNPVNNTSPDLPDADLNGDGMALELYTGEVSEINRLHRGYVRKVIETVNDLDNVLFEISNENHPGSALWQYDLLRFIGECEQSLPKKHPVGMTFQYKGGNNRTLFESPADWISPNPDGGYRDDPPDTYGAKVVITDTDHLWGIGGNPLWVWKSFLRGLNPIFMDLDDGRVIMRGEDRSWLIPIREAMGRIARTATRLDLARAIPHNALSSSGYCLGDPGRAYLVLAPDGGSVTLDLTGVDSLFSAEWCQLNGDWTFLSNQTVAAGKTISLTAPIDGPYALLLMRKP